ncbi:MAG TPA: toll/interleukin-1 receptor domain-containing protein [Sediminibacterium sp.]|nr:toll/interleukin-1 receptor domain-containing protein [Sediminibacterium sp.]
MQFPKDIFISYAHIDDESLIESQKGWITEFHRALEIRLAQLMGRRPVIWRDPALQGNHIFDQQIVDQFEQVAIMISILTPRYVKSEWCMREATEFYEACKKNIGFSINNQARIFKVIKTPVKIEQHPEHIRNILGYEFYTTDPTTGRLKELSQVFGQQSERLYWEKLDDLANDISGFLDNLEYMDGPQKATLGAVGGASPAKPSSQGKTPLKIYLAESSYETREFRDSLRRELQDAGCPLFPDKQLPLIAPVMTEQVQAYLKDSDLAIHLVGENYGIVPEGTQQSIVEIQNQAAAAVSAVNNLPRLIWIPDGFSPKEERQQAFVQKLSNGTEGLTGADLVFSSLEDFKAIVFDKIAAIEKERAKAEEKNVPVTEVAVEEKNTGIVYLICDMQDLDLIAPLEDFLFNSGFEVMLPLFEGDESQIREDHIENLKICDIAVIFYGKANEIWLRSKTRDFLKISGYGREKPLKKKIIYLAGEPSPVKERFRSQDAEVINGLQELPAATLKNALSNL